MCLPSDQVSCRGEPKYVKVVGSATSVSTFTASANENVVTTTLVVNRAPAAATAVATPIASGTWQRSRKRYQTGTGSPSAPATPIAKQPVNQSAGTIRPRRANRTSPASPIAPAANISGQRQRSSIQ